MDWERVLLSGFPLFFAIFWLGILHFTAWAGGWTRLAREFADTEEHVAKPLRRAWFQSGSLGLMNYGSCLNMQAYEDGVRLAVLWPFRPGHPPLFIPWRELKEAHEKRVFPFVRRLKVEIGAPNPVRVLLPTWVGEYVGGRG